MPVTAKAVPDGTVHLGRNDAMPFCGSASHTASSSMSMRSRRTISATPPALARLQQQVLGDGFERAGS